MAKDKNKKSRKAKADDAKVELIASPDGGGAKKGKKAKDPKGEKKDHRGLDQLLKLADHPLVGDLLAVGALAAVAAIAESKGGSAKAKSSEAVKAAGKAAAAAIGARLLKEVASKDRKKDADA